MAKSKNLSKECKPAVVFHEYVKSSRTIDGVVSCALAPLPIDKWDKPIEDEMVTVTTF